MSKASNLANVIIGTRAGGEPADELDHFYTCPACGQSVDMRDLGQVMHHEASDHKPITSDA